MVSVVLPKWKKVNIFGENNKHKNTFFVPSLIENCFQDNWTSTSSLRHRCRGMPDVFLMMEVKSGKLGNWPHGGHGRGGHLCLCVKTQRLVWRDGVCSQVWFWRRSEPSNFTQMMSSVIWQARICWRFSWKNQQQTEVADLWRYWTNLRMCFVVFIDTSKRVLWSK